MWLSEPIKLILLSAVDVLRRTVFPFVILGLYMYVIARGGVGLPIVRWDLRCTYITYTPTVG